jgi:hypothetical protein
MHTWYNKMFIHKPTAEALFNSELVYWCTLMSAGCLLFLLMLAIMIIAEEYQIKVKKKEGKMYLFFTSF